VGPRGLVLKLKTEFRPTFRVVSFLDAGGGSQTLGEATLTSRENLKKSRTPPAVASDDRFSRCHRRLSSSPDDQQHDHDCGGGDDRELLQRAAGHPVIVRAGVSGACPASGRRSTRGGPTGDAEIVAVPQLKMMLRPACSSILDLPVNRRVSAISHRRRRPTCLAAHVVRVR